MASRWFGRGNRSRSPQEQAATAARDGAVAAFLDLDTRQRFVTTAVEALAALHPGSALPGRWQRVEQTCFTATADYVQVSTQFEHEDSSAAAFAYQQTHRVLADAATAVDDFFQRNRAELESAQSALAATPRIAEAAVAETLAARQTLTAHPEIAGFRSVQAVLTQLDAATAELDRALAANSPTGVRAAAEAIHEVAGEASAAVAAAQGAESRATNSVSSLRTRIQAVGVRIERLPAARSTLLREFSEPNSIDLVGNLDLAKRELAAGEQAWRDGKEALGHGRAEDALDALARCREHLTTATEACDAVTDRLAALREAKADPAGVERQIRFRIRDVQRLVVDRGLVAEWGSVLDAQSRRVDLARDRLTGPHPDYWAYLTELRSVTEFVNGVLERVRQHH